jgi:hypothetical protein
VTAPTFGSAKPPPVERDRWGRPKIVGLDGKKVGYTRVTTFIDCLEDKTNLTNWKCRQVLKGAITGTPAERTALAKKVLAAHATEDKKALDGFVEDCLTRARSSDKAEEGTATHTLTEIIDGGKELPDGLDPATLRDLAAYRKATAGLTSLDIETFVVNDLYLTAGTFDRLYRVEPGFGWPDWLVGKVVIGDLKTGRVDYGLRKMAMQLGIYANSHRYDTVTFGRTDLGADPAIGLIVHLPAGEARCEVIGLDIVQGYADVALAKAVREHRKAATKSAVFSVSLRAVAA